MSNRKTQVLIIGGGPAGMLLGHLLGRDNIDNIVLEQQPRSVVLERIRAGVLEAGSVDILNACGLGDRIAREGKAKNGSQIVWQDRPCHFIDVKRWTGKPMFAYGQTALTNDLYGVRDAAGAALIDSAQVVTIEGIESNRPRVSYRKNGITHVIESEIVVGCDGAHGIARHAIPAHLQHIFQRSLPFGWLGIMVERPPLPDVTYAYHSKGFALAAQRNPMLSRYYVQAPLTDSIEDWSDQRFWDTLLHRFPPSVADLIQTGPSIEKSMAPLRSVVSEPMQHGQLFLAGDAAHTVPPTGAKGLNLAIRDVDSLWHGLRAYFRENSRTLLNGYSARALRRAWAAEHLSWRMTMLLHPFPDEGDFAKRLRETSYEILLTSEPVQQALAMEYAGCDPSAA